MADRSSPLGTLKKEPLPPPPEAMAHTAAPRDGDHERRYRILHTMEVPRGASSFLLRQGQVISSRGYAIAELERVGVKLEEVA